MPYQTYTGLFLQVLDPIFALGCCFLLFSFFFGLYVWVYDVFKRPYAHRSIDLEPLPLLVIAGVYFYWRLHG